MADLQEERPFVPSLQPSLSVFSNRPSNPLQLALPVGQVSECLCDRTEPLHSPLLSW